VIAPSRNDPTKPHRYFTPCSPGDPDAREMSWMDIAADDLLEPELTIKDFLEAVEKGRATVGAEDLALQIKFTEEFGQEG
jgi:vacuolar protein-sorting-associated protein 4